MTRHCVEIRTFAELIRTTKYGKDISRLRQNYILLSKNRIMKRNGEQIVRPLDVKTRTYKNKRPYDHHETCT